MHDKRLNHEVVDLENFGFHLKKKPATCAALIQEDKMVFGFDKKEFNIHDNHKSVHNVRYDDNDAADNDNVANDVDNIVTVDNEANNTKSNPAVQHKQCIESSLIPPFAKLTLTGKKKSNDSYPDHTTSSGYTSSTVTRNMSSSHRGSSSCDNNTSFLNKRNDSSLDFQIENTKHFRSGVPSFALLSDEKENITGNKGGKFNSDEIWIYQETRDNSKDNRKCKVSNNIDNTGSKVSLKEKNNNTSISKINLDLTCTGPDQSPHNLTMCRLEQQNSVKISEKWKVLPVNLKESDDFSGENPFFTNFTGFVFNIQETKVKCMEDWRDAVLHNYSVSHHERNSILTIHTFKFLLSRLVDNRLIYETDDGYKVIGSRRPKPNKNKKILCFGNQQLGFQQENNSEFKKDSNNCHRTEKIEKCHNNNTNSRKKTYASHGKKRRSRNLLIGYICMKVVVGLSKSFALL